MKIFNTINKYPFIVFYALAASIYWYAAEAGFYDDFAEFVKLHDRTSLVEFILSPVKSLYLGVNFFHYIFITLFRFNPILWYLLFTGLHAAAATLLYRFLGRWFTLMKWPNQRYITLGSTLLFLLSPLVTEVLIWRACSHYITTTICIFSILIWLLRYFETHRSRYPILIAAVFYLSTFLLEYFYLIPVYITIITVAAFWAGNIERKMALHTALKILLPICVLFLVYFITLKLKINATLARVDSGGASHITPGFALDRFSKYTIRVYLFDYFMPNDWRGKIEAGTATRISTLIVGLLFALVAAIGAWRYKRLAPKWKIVLTLFALSYASCIVLLPMWYYNAFAFEGHRYYYLPSIFFYTLLCSVIAAIFKNARWAKVFIGLYLILNLAGLLKIVSNAGTAGRITNELLDNFKWQSGDTVVLLNLPQHFNGVNMIQAHTPSNFHDYLRLMRNDTVSGVIYDVAGHHYLSKSDGIHLIVEDSTTIKVMLNQYGIWWWVGSYGAAPYENEMYKFTPMDNAFYYRLQLKRKPGPRTRILFQKENQWHSVNMSMIGIEQR
jgi:hypothetical protein